MLVGKGNMMCEEDTISDSQLLRYTTSAKCISKSAKLFKICKEDFMRLKN